MIVRALSDGWLVIRQADHARLAGEMLRLLRASELVESPRRAAIVRAVAEHDNGWWEEDAAPRLDLTSGGPLDFRSLPAPIRQEVWRRGVERYADDEPFVAALVAGHHLRLARRGVASAGFADELATRRDELLTAAGLAVDEAERGDRWLRLGDELSLVAATLEPALLSSPGWRIEASAAAEGVELRLDPFPWAGATRLALEARRLPAASWSDAVALGLAVATAPRAPLAVRLAPL